ncbi:hypothetical protein DFQ00_11147 [Paenibacillus barcinonensis]|uniref:Uncharacterized protein n=1 Tax=Paenibacillus barcinonensis TaxID=198119 RepID=A0A2V4VG88_PAEBA|nr:hypothetical protein DFQ00_11147 [Paenibacillus barcinonensis]
MFTAGAQNRSRVGRDLKPTEVYLLLPVLPLLLSGMAEVVVNMEQHIIRRSEERSRMIWCSERSSGETAE